MTIEDNGQRLRQVLAAAKSKHGITQVDALRRYNKGQAKPMALRTLKTYLAAPDSKTRVGCPAAVLQRMKKICEGA